MAIADHGVHGSSRLVLTADSAKTGLPRRIPGEASHADEPGFAYSAGRLLGRAEKQRAIRCAYISTAKAPCQAFARRGGKIIFAARRAPVFRPARVDSGFLQRGGALRRVRASESPPMRRSCRPRPTESAASPTKACAAPADARAPARAHYPSTSPGQSPVDS